MRKSEWQSEAGRTRRDALLVCLFAVLCAIAVAICGACTAGGGASNGSAQNSNAPTISVILSVDATNAHTYNEKWPSDLGTFELMLKEGASVYDALAQTRLAIDGSGRYVKSIGGLGEKACGPRSGWTYSVDGVFPSKSCGDYKLNGGEVIRWAYTVNDGDVQ